MVVSLCTPTSTTLTSTRSHGATRAQTACPVSLQAILSTAGHGKFIREATCTSRHVFSKLDACSRTKNGASTKTLRLIPLNECLGCVLLW